MSIGSYVREVGDLGLAVTITSATIGSVTVTTAGSGYIVGDEITESDITSETVVDSGILPATFVLTVATINGVGGILSFTITDAGTDGHDGDLTAEVVGGSEVGVPSEDYSDHDQYEGGGVQEEYVDSTQSGSKPKGVLGPKQVLVKNVLKAGAPQLAVQKRMIDGGSTTVWAETTIVDGKGNVVGNTLRAEDISDEPRCDAAGFTWVVGSTGDADQGDYGYCTEDLSTFDAALLEGECVRSGFYFDPDLTEGTDACIDTGTPANLTTYGEVVCKEGGYIWDGTDCVTFASIDFASETVQDDCTDLGGIWIAGTCYSPEDFGNGQAGDFSETVGSHNK